MKNAEIPSYQACGHRMPLGSDSAEPCFRCAMVAALIEELIRKQTRTRTLSIVEHHAPAVQ